MKQLLLNCDLGEKVHDNDALIMPCIDQANIACGLHASDPQTIVDTILLAKRHQVSIGAHPSYPDRENFGRASMQLSHQALHAVIQYQLTAFLHLAKLNNVKVDYVKPHGALYNDMMKNSEIFATVCQSIAELMPHTTLMIQALPDMTAHQVIAKHFELHLIGEAFADRNYQANGLLVPRSENNAVITDIEQVANNIGQFLRTGQLFAISGEPLSLNVDTLCVHGDNLAAVNVIKRLRQLINEH